MRNVKFMLFGAAALSVVALIVAGYGFGELRSASDRMATLEAQVAAVERVQAEEAETAIAADELARDVEILAGQVAELTERVNLLTEQVGEAPAELPEAENAEEAPAAEEEAEEPAQ